MGAFVDAALGVPAVFLTFLLVVVICYWLVVVLGASDVDALDGDVDPGGGTGDGTGGGLPGLLAGAGLGGVPVTVVLSLLIAVAWFVSLVGTVLLDDLAQSAPRVAAACVGVLAVAGLVAWLVVRVVVLPLRRMFPPDGGASRADFVGRSCVIRTGRIGPDFGQAEVTADDGSSAVIQVRQHREETRTAGTVALIYEYDPDGECFWVVPHTAVAGPDRPQQ